MIKNIFWDFDGVIAESLDVKSDAFYNLYVSFGKDIAEKVKDYHLANGGMSRFEKFKHFHNNYLGISISDQEVTTLANKFSNLVTKGVINAKEVKNIRETLESYYDKINFFIVTGTPTEESKTIVKAKGMDKYFIDIYGSPNNKIFICQSILNKYKYKAEETLFIGDAITDYKAAQQNRLCFLLRWNNANKKLFKDYKGFSLSDFTEFDSILETINTQRL